MSRLSSSCSCLSLTYHLVPLSWPGPSLDSLPVPWPPDKSRTNSRFVLRFWCSADYLSLKQLLRLFSLGKSHHCFYRCSRRLGSRIVIIDPGQRASCSGSSWLPSLFLPFSEFMPLFFDARSLCCTESRLAPWRSLQSACWPAESVFIDLGYLCCKT